MIRTVEFYHSRNVSLTSPRSSKMLIPCDIKSNIYTNYQQSHDNYRNLKYIEMKIQLLSDVDF